MRSEREMKWMWEQMEKYRELIGYGFWGVMTTLVNYVIYFACTKLAGIDYLVSNGVAWGVAVIFAFLVNKVLVFHSMDHSARTLIWEFGSFVSARVLSGALETGMLALFVGILHFSDSVIKIAAGILVIIINYFLSKMLIFRKRGEKQNEDNI
ncbi:MAG: GtrA family protein [Roseburia sp.]